MKDERIETDERIQTTRNRIAAITSQIWYWLLLISLCYRTLILKQHLREFWDIFAILLIGSTISFLAHARKGLFDHAFKSRFLIMSIVLIITLLALHLLKGQIHSVGDVGGFLIAILLGLAPVVGIAYFLNRRWKRKEGIEDEK